MKTKLTDDQLKDMALGEALANFLSGIEDHISNAEALDAVATENWDLVSPWDKVQDMDGEELAQVIEACANGIYQLVKNVAMNATITEE